VEDLSDDTTACMQQNNFEKAKVHFEKGLNFLNHRMYDLSEKEFYLCLELLPDRLSVIENLIKIFVLKKEVSKLDSFLKKYDHIKEKKEIQFGIAHKEYFNKNYDDSIRICKNLLNFSELEIEALILLAENNLRKKEFLNSLKIYKRILYKKRDFETYYFIGNLLFEIGKTRQALYYHRKSFKMNNQNKSNLWNLSLCLLKLKFFTEGFEFYDTRWELNLQVKKHTNIPLATETTEILNKKILIWDEQGLGDTIQFSRFVIDLIKYSKQITLVVNKKLKNLLSHISPFIKVFDYEMLDIEKEKFDFQLPICSLPRLLEIKKIEDISYYPLKLPKFSFSNSIDKNTLNVGIAWSGNPNYSHDEYRSIPFHYFKKIFNLKRTNFYKLSKDLKNIESREHEFYNIKDLGNNDFYTISHIMKDLDIVISCDTSIIHLSGILGVNSILLLNFNSDWRWFDNNKTTPWYPSVKIIKQKEFNNWQYVFDQLNNEITRIHEQKFTLV